jgi:hypothetical protein
MSHVKYMRKLAGGTLIVDAEANYWLKLINDPGYVSQWRWTKGVSAPAEGKRSLARKIGYVNAILVVVVLVAVMMPHVGVFRFTPTPVETKTSMAVYGLINLTLVSAGESGWYLRVNDTDSGSYPGGYVAALVAIERTDSAFAARTMMLNLTSYLYYRYGDDVPPTPYVVNVTWYVQDLSNPELFHANVIEGDGAETFFGLPIELPQDRQLFFLVVIGLREIYSGSIENYAILTATGSDERSTIVFYGGYSIRF